MRKAPLEDKVNKLLKEKSQKHDALKKLNTWKQMKKAGKLTKAEIKADFMKRLRTNVIAMIGQEGRIRQI